MIGWIGWIKFIGWANGSDEEEPPGGESTADSSTVTSDSTIITADAT